MRSLKALALTAAVLLAPLAAGQTQQPAPDWRFADPGAQLIGGLDVHGLLDSPLVKSALDQAAAKMGDAATLMRMTLGTLSGVSQVYFSITGRKEDADGLMMVKGTLTDAAVRAFMQGGGIAGMGDAGPKPAQPKVDMARVDATTVLVGSPALLGAAVRRLQRPAPAASPLLARAKTLAAGNDFWIGGTLPDIPVVALIGGGIKGLALGLSLQHDLRLQVSLDMATAELAKQMAAQVRKSVDEASRNQPGLDTKLEAKVVGTTLNITSTVDGDQILKTLAEKLQDGVSGPGALFGGGPTKTATTAAPSEPAAPPQPRTVKIFGLDDGTREVPFPTSQH
jgi:hypothetical protein